MLLIIITLLLVNCNPFDFGQTVLLKLESDTKSLEFDCNKKSAESVINAYNNTAYKTDGGLYFKQIGINTFLEGDQIKLRLTHSIDGVTAQNILYIPANKNTYNKCVKKLGTDTLFVTNLKIEVIKW